MILSRRKGSRADFGSCSAFMRALKAQGIDRNNLPYKAPLQPFGSWFALSFTGLVLTFNGKPWGAPYIASRIVS